MERVMGIEPKKGRHWSSDRSDACDAIDSLRVISV